MRYLVILASFVLTLTVLAAGWPRFLGPNGDGRAPDKNLNKDWTNRPPVQLWKVPMNDGGFSGPAIADGILYIVDHKDGKDVVRAMNAATGQDVWSYAYQDAQGSNYGFTQSTPLVDNGKLYVVSRLGQVFCFNAATGTPVWGTNLIRDYGARLPDWQMAWSPFIDEDKLICIPGAADGTVLALHKDTGKFIWKGGGTDKPGYATPVLTTINGVCQYVVFAATSVNGVEAATGKLLWTFPWQTAYNVNAATPIVGENYVFITSNYNRGGAFWEITPEGPKKLWENRNIQSHFNTPVAIDGLLYSTTDPGKLVCVDPWDNGKVRWQQQGFGKGGLIEVDGVLLVLDGNNGELAMVKVNPDAYQELGRFTPLGGQSWTAPVVADGKLYVRNQRMLACFDLK